MMKPATIAKKLAIVMMATSRCGDVAQLVGEHALELVRLEPVEQPLRSRRPTACLGLRPVANAFGMSASARSRSAASAGRR